MAEKIGGSPFDGRRHARHEVDQNLRATIKDEEGNEHEVIVQDISAGGAGLLVDGSFGNDAFVELHMEGVGKIPAKVARDFVNGIGVEFQLEDSKKEEMKEEIKKFRLAVAREKS
ncbi:MAG: PilZ domain-containing protein [Rhodospirillales bacterium]|nr:PilZ domain-containing protein [Rhodospirillales bacterium]